MEREDQIAVSTESSVQRRGIGPTPILLAAALLIGAVAFWPRSSPPLADDQGALAPINETSLPPPPTEVGSTPLPMELEGLFLVVETADGHQTISIAADGTTSVTEFGPLQIVPDSNGTHVAAIDAGGLLWAGSPKSLSVVDTEVSGFEWHDTRPGNLLYTTMSPDSLPEVVEWTFTDDLHPRVLVSSLPGRAVWFGQNGFALIDPDRQILWLRGPLTTTVGAGQLVRELPFGRILSGSPEGGLYFSGEIDSLVVNLETGALDVPDHLRARRLADTALAPNRERAALLTFSRGGVETLLVVDSNTVIRGPESVSDASSLAWSPDNRIVAYVQGQQVGLIEVASGSAATLLDVPLDGELKYVRIQ